MGGRLVKKPYSECELIFVKHPIGTRFVNRVGWKFGELTVLGYAGKTNSGAVHWYCKCDCGNITKAKWSHISDGSTVSCGCFAARSASARERTHCHSVNGKASPTYSTWRAMKSRCLLRSSRNFDYYGGRGITVCDRWLESFENFLSDMGERPVGASIDRIDNDKGYYKENCRWATTQEQQSNRSDNVLITYNGEQKTQSQWAEYAGILVTTFRNRIASGWSIERAITQKLRGKNGKS